MSYRKISRNLEGRRSFFFYSFPIALKFGSRLGSNAVEDPVKFQNNAIVLTFSRVETLRDPNTVRFLTGKKAQNKCMQDCSLNC